MADSSPTGFWGGLMAAIQGAQSDPGIQNLGTSPIYNAGLGLLASSAPHLFFQAPSIGESLMGAQQLTNQNRAASMQQQMSRMNMDMMSQTMPIMAAIRRAQFNDMRGASPQASPQDSPQAATYPGIASDSPPLSNAQSGGLMDPVTRMKMGALMSTIPGMQGGKEQMDLGKMLAFEYNPAYQAQAKALESPVAIDLLQIKNAQAQNNPDLAAQLQNKLLMDTKSLNISDRNGAITRVGPGGQTTSVLPQEGIQVTGNQATLLPGMGGALYAKSGAEAQGRATGELTEVTDAAGNKYTLPKSALLNNRGPAPLTDIGPGRKTLLNDQSTTATATFKESQAQADASNLQLAQIGDLKSAANDFTPGKFAESRGEMLQYLASSGLITPTQAKSLGSFQAGQKISIQLQSAATKALGSREAAQVFGAMGKSIPNLTMSQDGLNKVSAFMEGMARYNIARAQTIQQRFNSGDVNGVNAVKDEYYQKTNPMFYILASADPATRRDMLKSTANPSKLMTDWVNAYKSGMAPSPQALQ